MIAQYGSDLRLQKSSTYSGIDLKHRLSNNMVESESCNGLSMKIYVALAQEAVYAAMGSPKKRRCCDKMTKRESRGRV